MTDTMSPDVRELPLGADGTVEIDLGAGDLRLRGTDTDRVVVRARDGAPLADDVAVTHAPGRVRVADGSWGLRLGPLSINGRRSRDLDVEIPRTARVELRTLSGDVVATGIAGPSRWASASGDLRLAVDGGPVQVETMSGNATLEATAAIDLGARTVSGDLRVQAPRLVTSDLGTTSGDVRIGAELARNGSHVISSVSGDVELATSSPVRLETQTLTGRVRADGTHRAEGGRMQRTLVVGDGSVRVSVRTTSGDIRLRAGARPATPAPPAAPAPDPEPMPPADGLPAIAEATAGPVGPRPVADEDTQGWPAAAWSAPSPAIDRREAARLDILRALERGDLDIESASQRLQVLEDAGPRSFRGWC
jgi:hypothetical protein